MRESVHWAQEDICTEWKTLEYLELASLALRDVSSSEQNFLRAHPVLKLGRNRKLTFCPSAQAELLADTFARNAGSENREAGMAEE